tara:strand:+ start:590 stop:769 length:180 start_codon:yes stop_codon:yes gene_type:complete
MNRDLVVAVANKVNDEDSVVLWDIIQKGREEGFWDLSENTDVLYQLCLIMLETNEGEEE